MRKHFPPLTVDDTIALTEAFCRNGRLPWRTHRACPGIRSLRGVTEFLVRAGLHVRKRAAAPWRTNEIATLQRMWNGDAHIDDIAIAVGHSRNAIFVFVDAHRERYHFRRRRQKKITDGQTKAIGREFELAVTRAMQATGRTRGSVVTRGVRYLMREAKRAKMDNLWRHADVA